MSIVQPLPHAASVPLADAPAEHPPAGNGAAGNGASAVSSAVDPPGVSFVGAHEDLALKDFLQLELSALRAAIAGFLDMMIEDAEATAEFDDLRRDLQRMQSAAEALSDLIARACAAARPSGAGRAAFDSRLRHDLRTPLNAIKGYSEILIEDMSEVEGTPFVVDLRHVISSADQMLARIDKISDIAAEPFDATLPLAENDDRPVRVETTLLRRGLPPRPAIREDRLAGRILVVDDEPSNRDLLGRRLDRDGHAVVLAEDGAGALAMLAEAEFDLILLDMIMPGLSGFEVLARLKSEPRTRHIPVIVISALDEIDSVVRCIEAGAEDYLPKTFNPTLLRARISASLEKKALRDREAVYLDELRREKQRSETLLLNILPQSIVSRMRGGESAIADRFEAVTILFCDLVGFTPLAAGLSPGETVALLSAVFSAFDRAVADRGVEKIKTIGDSYMVAGGIPEPLDDHARRVACLAFDMLRAVEEIGRRHGAPLSARIGIHTGEAVAGVIGQNRFAYDVWGDTVNTAARMESHGEAGRIQISAATQAALGGGFAIEARGPIAIKGKGAMETYFLLGPATPN